MRRTLVLALSGLSLIFNAAAQQATPSLGGAGAGGGNAAGGTAAPIQLPTITNSPTLPAALPGGAAQPAAGGEGGAAQDAARNTFGAATQRVANAPNEFQRFVQASTGQTVPVFGEGFFSGGAQTFAPVDRIPVPAEYVLGPGDELHIRAWGNVDVDYRAVIDRNGQISIPRIGTMGVAGLKAGEVEGHLRTQIGRIFKGFSLNVTLGQLRSIQVFVVGQANRPGTYTVSSLSTLVNAVFASGGPGANGSMRRVQLKRGNSVVAELDLYDFIVNGDKSKDARLLPGDTIVYPPAGPRVAVLGAVDTSAIFELKAAGSPLGELLALAGGNRAHTNGKLAQLERLDPTSPKAPRQVQSVDLPSARQLMLRDGDVLTIFAAGPQFANAVTLRGNVAAPLRYPYQPGMRVSQLIPEREALITPDYYVRKNKLVQFLEARNTSATEVEGTVRNLLDEPNWEYATIERLDAGRITTVLVSFNLGKAVIDRAPEHDLELQPGDVVTIFGSRDLRRPQARGLRLVRVEGEVDRPGVYQLQPGETLRGLLDRAGGLTPQAYLFGTEFARESTRIKQRQALDDALRRLESSLAGAAGRRSANLSTTDAAAAARLQAAEEESLRAQLARLRAMQPNGRISLELNPAIKTVQELPDVPLEDGDRLLVPPRPGFVFAVGAVANDNALIWRPGRTLRNYLMVAGLLPDADEANIFVVRADGSVVHSRDTGGGLFSRSRIESLELAPGDTLVVPELLDRETSWAAFVRGAKDWTQILSNFGLAAAAIRTLRN
jgi:protein involved in polysaccharide export with SLBB domain